MTNRKIKKIYGEYKGLIKNPKEIKNMDEIKLYFLISTLFGSVKQQQLSRLNIFENKERKYTLDFLIKKGSETLGIETAKSKITGHIKLTPLYKQWFNFYEYHFEKTLSKKEREEVKKLDSFNMDIEKYKPKESWKDFKVFNKELKKIKNK